MLRTILREYFSAVIEMVPCRRSKRSKVLHFKVLASTCMACQRRELAEYKKDISRRYYNGIFLNEKVPCAMTGSHFVCI